MDISLIIWTLLVGVFIGYLVVTSKQQTANIQKRYSRSSKSFNNRESNDETLKNIKNEGRILESDNKIYENDPTESKEEDLNNQTASSKNTSTIGDTIFLKELEEIKTYDNFGNKKLLNFHKTNINVKLPPKLVLVTDLDHTLFGKDDNESHENVEKYLKEFNELWIENYASKNCVLVYATGRNFKKYTFACKEYANLMTPDILVCKDGVDIYWFNRKLVEQVQQNSTHNLKNSLLLNGIENEKTGIFYWFDESWSTKLNENWNQLYLEKLHQEWVKNNNESIAPLPLGSNLIEKYRIALVVKTSQIAEEAEKYFNDKVNQYNKNIKNQNDKIDIHTFWCIERGTSSYWSAMTSKNSGKGNAVEWISQRLRCNTLETNNFIICGDSGNDISMLKLPKYNSVIVSNCSHELKEYYSTCNKNKNYMTTNKTTMGVIEGLKYWSNKIDDDWTLVENLANE